MTAHKKFKRLVRQRAERTGESYAAARRQVLLRTTGERMNTTTPGAPGFTEVTIESIRNHASWEGGAWGVVELQDDGQRRLFLMVGVPEAQAIALAVAGAARPRPMTHDMLGQALEALEARLVRLVISHDAQTRVFHADAVLHTADGSERHVDCRPSDGLALAARTVPRPTILVPDGLLSEVDRPSQSDFTCPVCSADRADTVVIGPAPTEPEWLVGNFHRAVTDGLLIHEPDESLAAARQLWQCPSGHRFTTDDGLPMSASVLLA